MREWTSGEELKRQRIWRVLVDASEALLNATTETHVHFAASKARQAEAALDELGNCLADDDRPRWRVDPPAREGDWDDHGWGGE